MNVYNLGDVKIYRITESENSDIKPTFFFPGTTREMWEREASWMKPQAMDKDSGDLIFPIQCHFIDTGSKKILLDSCVGDDKERATRSHWHLKHDGILLNELASIGISPDMIDYVVSTHLHADHVGWFTEKKGDDWVPTFPNAEYVIQETEYNFWVDKHQTEPLDHLEDSVLPVFDAGLIRLVSRDYVLEDILSFIQTPGHTPNHCSIKIESEGETGIFTGDLIHSPVQCKNPDWYVRPDYDHELAIKTRKDFFKEYADSGVVIFPTHICSPSIGRIVKDGAVYKYEFV
ncbi:MAG: MBL fold metallo-hydrolase [Spirochaetales bacterium]|uniref:MBL fold metallo-hydrolase n=1 Tax=Candidatus Thalassospirochaeta sargassi TaxID=3119039 RepID=A0AAJ1MKN8_9SPIO|nr:MBL fold metallo-hydrolase [Spirochaetales bacterium]